MLDAHMVFQNINHKRPIVMAMGQSWMFQDLVIFLITAKTVQMAKSMDFRCADPNPMSSYHNLTLILIPKFCIQKKNRKSTW